MATPAPIDPKTISALNKAMKDADVATSKAFKKATKNLHDVSDVVSELRGGLIGLDRNIRKLHLEKVLDTKRAKGFQAQIDKISKTLTASKGMGFEKQQEAIKQATKDAEGLRQAYEQINKAADLKFSLKQPGTFKDIFKDISSTPDVLSVMGKAAKGLGNTLGGVTGILSGWPGAILAGVKALWDMGMAADQFVKDANKAFARVRGPDIMTSDVKKQFKDFNDQIFNAGENIRVGLNAQDIRAFLEATTQAGLNITTLNRGLTTYRDAIYIASKASKTLGIELPQVGDIMGKLITNFRMDMDQVDETFVQVAFDAKKSGLSTNTFWTAVENASASLAMYGIFVKDASKKMSQFTKTGVMGAQETAQTVDELTQSFSKMNETQKATFAGLVMNTKGGSEAMVAAAKDLQKQFQDQANAIQPQIDVQLALEKNAKKEGNVDELNKIDGTLEDLYKQQANYQRQADNASKDQINIAGKNAVAFQSNLASYSKEVAGWLQKFVIKIPWTKMNDEQLLLAQKIAETQGYSGEMIKRMSELGKSYNDEYKKRLDAIQKNSDMQLQSGETDNQYLDRISRGTTESEKFLTKLSKMDKPGHPFMKAFIKLLRSDDKSRAENQRVVDGMREDLANTAVNTGEAQIESVDGLKKDADSTLKNVVKQTLSNKEMWDIAKDEVAWRANSLGALQKINNWVFSLFDISKKHFGMTGYKDAGQKMAEKRLTDMGVDLSDIPKTLTEGLAKQDDLQKSYDAQNKKLKDLTEKASKSGKIDTGAYKTAQDGLDKIKKQLDAQLLINQNLISLDDSNKEIVDIQQDNIMSDPDKAKKWFELAKSRAIDASGAGKFDPGAFMEQMKAWNIKDIAGFAKATKDAANEALAKKAVDYTASQIGAGGSQYGGTPLKATLNRPEIVSSPGMVRMDPGEALLPREYSSFNTIPAITGNVGPAGNFAGGAKSFNITFNANGLTEKSLAQKVLNEIRGVLYKESLTAKG